jgi:hypothetical protein
LTRCQNATKVILVSRPLTAADESETSMDTPRITWTANTPRAARANHETGLLRWSDSSVKLAVDEHDNGEWRWSVSDRGLHRTLGEGRVATQAEARAAAERIALLIGRRVTLRNVGQLSRVSGTLMCDGVEWTLDAEGAGVRVLRLVGVGYEHVIESAIVVRVATVAA